MDCNPNYMDDTKNHPLYRTKGLGAVMECFMFWDGQGKVPEAMIPEGYILADGRQIDASVYPELASIWPRIPNLNSCIVTCKTAGMVQAESTRVWVVKTTE